MRRAAFRPLLTAAPRRAPAPQLYRHAGVAADGFQGVPLFQAEGLTIRGDKGRYTPLFFRCGAGRAAAARAPVWR